jgi:hypothetical protein
VIYKTRSTGGAALPGYAADGKTYKEALANVEIIIQEWIETAKELGRPIPAPRGPLSLKTKRQRVRDPIQKPGPSAQHRHKRVSHLAILLD